MKLSLFLLVVSLIMACAEKGAQKPQPGLGIKSVKIIEKGRLKFRDLNKNGKLDKYEDWRLSDEERINDLVSQMTLEEKIGLMFHPNIAVPADGVVKYHLTDEEKASAAKAAKERYAGPVGPGGQAPAGGPMAVGQMRRTAAAKSFI